MQEKLRPYASYSKDGGNSRLAPFAVVAFVLSIVSLLAFAFAAPLALLCGIIGLVQIRNSEGELYGKAWAWSGVGVSFVVLLFWGMYSRAIPGLGWYHEQSMTKDICGVAFQTGSPIASADERDFFGEGFLATAYHIPERAIGSLRNLRGFVPKPDRVGNSWHVVGWKTSLEPADRKYFNFVFQDFCRDGTLRNLATTAVSLPETVIAYVYRTESDNSSERLCEVHFYIIDFENRLLLVGECNI